MNDIRCQLSEHITVESVVAENSLWIEDRNAEFSVMLPLNATYDISYFEDGQSMVLACPYEWSCVHVRTTRDQALHFAESLHYPIDVYAADEALMGDNLSKSISQELGRGRSTSSRKPGAGRKRNKRRK